MRTAKLIEPGERLKGGGVDLRLVTLDDCTPRYLAWLDDPEVNRFLETRWREQSLGSVREFVAAMLESENDYLFAIEHAASRTHIGNIKVGPVNRNHFHADVSYFIGEKQYWGKGYATEAIALATQFAFERLKLNRVQAGLYQENAASGRALEKVGYVLEGTFRRQLRTASNGEWQDHLWYGLLKDEWIAPENIRRRAAAAA
jgi:RimJ/RimL family protein N-acetyltransferase